jgi:hypothetical protein
MISVVMSIPISRFNTENLDRLEEVHGWLRENVGDHWALVRMTMGAIKVGVWGPNQEQDMVAFKLRFQLCDH